MVAHPNEGQDSSSEEPTGDGNPWYAKEIPEIALELDTSIELGLTGEEARDRLDQYGPNELGEAPGVGFWRMLLDQFDDFIVLVLLVAAFISAILGDFYEAVAILAIVSLNASLGVVQERRAEEALAALKRMAAPQADVLRSGHRVTVPARELVPGDVVHLEAGNFVPADIRLTESASLLVEEAALTGESVSVEKEAKIVYTQVIPLGDRRNTAFSGTVVSHGRGLGVVVATGMRTQIGMIATMLQSIEVEETPLQKRLSHLGKILGYAALAVCGIVFVIGWLRGFPILEMFLIAVSLAVAAVPEGLPAVVTITLALGMREMVRRHALIRRLSSVETLGSTTVICSDKTGTLTENQMTVTRLWIAGQDYEVTGPSYAAEGEFCRNGVPISLDDHPAVTTSLWLAALANNAVLEEESELAGNQFRLVGDPTETALAIAAAKANIWRKRQEKTYPRIGEIPFDSARKRMTTVHRIGSPQREVLSPFAGDSFRGWEVAAVKGAPEVILSLCTRYQTASGTQDSMTETMRQAISSANKRMAQDALRVLAVAYRLEETIPEAGDDKEVEVGLTFVGLLGMIDPPRTHVPEAIAKAQRAGVRTVMITGDYPDTARTIAHEIGLFGEDQRVITGGELDGFDDEHLSREVREADTFARVSPVHKVRIVEALKRNNEVVAMTGDGVNDAPALKRADIGVAMGITGTDVAKETADMVLTDDNYVSIVSAVEQGRIIYSNIRKFVFYLLSCNVAEIAVIFVAILAGLPSPLSAIQLLWLNLVTDGAPALALGMEQGDPDTMDRPPRPADEPVINRLMFVGIMVQTVAIAVVTLTAYLLGLQLFAGSPGVAETMAFSTLSFSELLRAFTARSELSPLHQLGFFSNRYMIYAVLSSMILLALVIYVPFLQSVFNTVPMSVVHWQIMLPLLVIPSIVQELTKMMVFPRMVGRGVRMT